MGFSINQSHRHIQDKNLQRLNICMTKKNWDMIKHTGYPEEMKVSVLRGIMSFIRSYLTRL